MFLGGGVDVNRGVATVASDFFQSFMANISANYIQKFFKFFVDDESNANIQKM